jgi:PAS domain S-box-containing protein
MNTVGNDNYRPGLKPPEPLRRNGGWLSSNMAQLMVFLNGLILTITAFATLSVFIDEIVKEGLVKVTEDVNQYISSGYQETERSFNALSTVLSMSDFKNLEQIKSYAKETSSGADYFDEVYILDLKDSNDSTKPLYGDLTYLNSFKSNLAFKDFIRIKESAFDNDLNIITSMPNFNLDEQGFEKQSNKSRFALVKTIGNPADQNLLIGIARFDRLIQKSWLDDLRVIRDLQIIDVSSDLPVFTYQAQTGNKGNQTLYTNLVKTEMAGRDFNIKINLNIHSRESFLQKIPLLMLLFGITLTLIGTLYVRNNQSQSKKLANMNKELAHKNFELNQEISERERLNQVIQKSARENRAIVNSVSDIIFELSIDGKILFLNDSWGKVTGFEKERSIGRNLFDLLYATDQQEQRDNFNKLVEGKSKSYRSFTRLRSADGSYRAIELAMSMTRKDENQELHVVGTITDVEERRRAERALSEAEKKYRTIVENAAGGIYQVTPDGQFLSANPALAKILGYSSPEEILRDITIKDNSIYVDAAARSKFLSDITSLDMTKNIELQIKRKDGEVIWVSENVRAVRDDEGTLLFYEGSMENVDQRKKAEIALTVAKSESDLANRAKSEFLANMSHELRTPLNAVIGFSEIIKNEAFGPLPNKEYKEYADDIHASGNRLLRVINEILDVSRIEAGERTLNETVVKVSETVKSCLELSEGKLKVANMRVENKITDTSLGIIGEGQALKQMLLNLMSNAIKFSPENSFLMLDAEIDSKGRLRLSITDTGIGMDDAELEKALSPFGQINTEHNRTKSGTGLGLTLVKSLIELHGGALELLSQKGIGTTATLIFPKKRVTNSRETIKREFGDSLVEPKDV